MLATPSRRSGPLSSSCPILYGVSPNSLGKRVSGFKDSRKPGYGLPISDLSGIANRKSGKSGACSRVSGEELNYRVLLPFKPRKLSKEDKERGGTGFPVCRLRVHRRSPDKCHCQLLIIDQCHYKILHCNNCHIFIEAERHLWLATQISIFEEHKMSHLPVLVERRCRSVALSGFAELAVSW